jgi:hypothetical protein
MKFLILSANTILIAALVLASAGIFIFTSEIAHATPYGTNITKDDGINPGGLGVGKEDNEAEPGMVQSQVWDLEGFFLEGKKLTIIGGYNFYTGQDNIKAGDIFIDTNGDAVYSPNIIPGYIYAPYSEVSNGLFKYDYVLDINWAGGTFNIIQLNQDSLLKDTEYGAQYNKPSNPWIYVSGGNTINASPLSFNTYNKASQSDTSFSGWDGNNNHYVGTFDISAIDLSNGAVFHNTMECGNDNLIGQTAAVPEPTSILLLGLGLIGLARVRKRMDK